MILCLNLNAAIDKTIVVSTFEINKIHRPESVIALAGGKGCNVARALKTLGEAPVVSGWVGGFAGQFIETELHREGIQTDFVQTDFESRTCTSILDRGTGTMTEIYEAGESVPLGKIEELRAHIQAIIGNYKAVTLSGSLPPGVSPDFYAGVIEIARQAGVLTFLDSSGEALRQGLEAGPFFVKPNETETRSLLGFERSDSPDFAQAAVEISTKYKTNVLLSMGVNGAIAAQGQTVLLVKSPRVGAKSAVGSGDCSLAGLTYGTLHGFSFEEAIICGVAAGTANTLTIGAGQFKFEDFEWLRGQIHVSHKMI
ncbi:MAG TPA: 1-phosphofructokinase family hexose kinase [Anaerolineales bacterium]|nr:1-phosphofructokinase family hexose kinase [Anaerolineales bacterium]